MIIYISAPYANGDIEDNIKKVIDCADELCELGHVPSWRSAHSIEEIWAR